MSASFVSYRPFRFLSLPRRISCGGQLRCIVLALLMSISGFTHASVASQSDEAASGAKPQLEIAQVELGFEGHYKIGFWTNLRVNLARAPKMAGQLRVVCPDGDGTETVYELLPASPVDAASGEPASGEVESASNVAGSQDYAGLIRVGRLDFALRLQWVDSEGQVAQEWPLSDFVRPKGLRSTDELMIVLGEAQPILAAMTRSKAADSDRSIIELKHARSIPELWVGWDAVDRLIINPGEASFNSELTSSQTGAIEQWVQQGGDVVLALGARATTILSDSDRLESRLLPGSFEAVIEHSDSAGFETYALANDQLLSGREETIAIARVVNFTGEVEAFEGRDEFDLPLVVRSPFGLGQVTFLSIDIDEPHFAEWEGRNRFLAKVLKVDARSGDASNRESGGGRVSHLGYTDMSGQLRSAMDRFDGVQLITFTWVAVLIVLFIICIGPADYFLLKRVVRRMEWTWLTFSLMVILFCAIAIATVQFTKGSTVKLNRVEVVDVDLASHTVRGNLWLTIYSPKSQRYSLEYASSESTEAIQMRDQLIAWQGLPGTGLGGMDSAIATSVVGQPYRCELKRGEHGWVSSLESVPIQVASTKTFHGRWSGELTSQERGELILDSRSDALSGTIVNPLGITLSNCVVLYGTWAYVIDGDFEPGASIDIERDTTERTLDAFLTRRRLNAGRDEMKEWDPTSDDVARIVEMMSFYDVAGGEDYTSLTQRLHHNLDLSGHLTPDRAIVIGTAQERTTSVKLGNQDAASLYDQDETYYRMLVPVRDPYGRDVP